MFDFFRKRTLRQLGQLGNATRRQRERERVHATCDDMRKQMGLPKVDWENLA